MYKSKIHIFVKGHYSPLKSLFKIFTYLNKYFIFVIKVKFLIQNIQKDFQKFSGLGKCLKLHLYFISIQNIQKEFQKFSGLGNFLI